MTKHTETMENFDIDRFEELVKGLRNTYRAASTFEKSRAELQEQYDEAHKANIEALEDCNLEEVTKQTTRMKNLKRRLEESPEEKLGAFDNAVAELQNFFGSITDWSAVELHHMEQAA